MVDNQKIRICIEGIIENRMSVEGRCLRHFTIGRRFGKTLHQQDSKRQKKALRACADVVVAAPGLLKARSDHPLRAADIGTAPVRTRSSDGATARRCYIERDVPAALRLHYWLLPDGTVELASVNDHCDMNIPI